MTIKQLKYVIDIVNCGSMREAARQLEVTEASLSSSIKKLEAELGIELLLRSVKGIELSVHGADFLVRATQIVELSELLETRYSSGDSLKNLLSVPA